MTLTEGQNTVEIKELRDVQNLEDAIIKLNKELRKIDEAFGERFEHTQAVDGVSDSDVTAHAESDGSSHGFLDQDVTIGSSPAFDGTNFTGIDHTTALTNVGVFAHADIDDVFAEFYGAIKETIAISIDASGANIVFSLEGSGSTDLTLVSATGFITLDTTPAKTVNLTAGTATVPKENFIYINSGQSLVTDTAWPAATHWPIARVTVLTRALTNTNGPLKVHAFTDHFSEDGVGHIGDISEKIREMPATYVSGVALTPTPAESGSGATMSVATTEGLVFQLHVHTMPARDTSTDGIFVINHPTAYTNVTDMATLLTDANNVSLTNKHYALVIWGVVSENESECQLFCNLPTGSYNTQARATVDADRFTVYDVPTSYSGASFLIARLVVRNQSDSTFHMNVVEDLRGKVSSTSPGGGAGITSHSGLTNLAWSVAAHSIDANIDMNSNSIINVVNVDGVDVGTDVPANTTHRGLTNNPHSVTAAQMAAIAKAIGTTKGDIIGFSGSATPVRLPVGASNGRILAVDSGEETGVKYITGAQAAHLHPFEGTADAGTWTAFQTAAQIMGFLWYNSTNNLNDEFTCNEFWLEAGTYDFKALGYTYNFGGKCTWTLDGQDIVVDQDWYTVGAVANVTKTVNNVVVGNTGTHTLSCKVTAAGAGANHIINLTHLYFVETAD